VAIADALPDSPLAVAALALAREHEHPAILNHSVRTYVHARRAATAWTLREGADYDGEELFVACVLHDLGTSDRFDGPQRFEVEGADAATEFLTEWSADPAARTRVWEAIALHTSPGLAERLGPLTRLTRVGVLMDFGRPDPPAPPGVRDRLEAAYPRLDIERELADAVVRQAIGRPTKAPASSWPGGLLQAHLDELAAGSVNPAF
jgi:hypothetical protein